MLEKMKSGEFMSIHTQNTETNGGKFPDNLSSLHNSVFQLCDAWWPQTLPFRHVSSPL